MLWTNHAALWLKASIHITPTRPQNILKRNNCQLKFKVPCMSRCKCLWTLETFPWVAQGFCVSPVVELLTGIGSQSSVQKKKSLLSRSTHLNCTKKWSEVGHVYHDNKLGTLKKKRFLVAKYIWSKGTFWEEYLWNCTQLSNIWMLFRNAFVHLTG